MLRDDAQAPDEAPSAADASLVRRVGPAVVATVSRYRVIEKIAAGSMGVVYRAKDRHLGRDVALKVLRLDSRAREKPRDAAIARARFVQEARAMARLSHPNVVPIYGIETVGDHLVIAMEYVPGLTLAQWLQTPRSWSEIVDVMLSAGEGLAAAHAAGAVHRDFKPHNVLVGDDGRVRVTDFGLALVREAPEEITEDSETVDPHPSGEPHESLTQTGMAVGTPAYMAPEQHVGRSLDPRSDQYAFCATLYEAIYGTRPFRGRDNVELAQAKRRLQFCVPRRDDRRVPSWLAITVRRGLAPIAAERFETMHALLVALRGRSRSRAPMFAAIGGTLIGVLAGGALANLDPVGANAVDSDPIDALAPADRKEPGRIELSRCRRSLAAGWLPDAERHCALAYFGALERGAFADAVAAAELLAGVSDLAGSHGEARQWRRHAEATRRRAAQ
jgi:eukaryotic-like serine/threonine-protein kinase